MARTKRRAAGAKMRVEEGCILIRRAPMAKAVACALEGMKKGGGPFGACITTIEGKIVACAANSVIPNHNPSQHAEVNAISAACRKLRTHVLDEHILYTTTEPCLMCRGAAYWAQIPVIVYGTNQTDARRAGFDELNLTDRQFLKIAARKQIILADFMRKECMETFKQFRRRNGRLY